MDEPVILRHKKVFGWWQCEGCKKVYPDRVMEAFNDCQYKPRFRYCPNCGRPVVMEEEHDERRSD